MDQFLLFEAEKTVVELQQNSELSSQPELKQQQQQQQEESEEQRATACSDIEQQAQNIQTQSGNSDDGLVASNDLGELQEVLGVQEQQEANGVAREPLLRVIGQIVAAIKRCRDIHIVLQVYSIFKIFASVVLSRSSCENCFEVKLLMTLIVTREIFFLAFCNNLIGLLRILRDQVTLRQSILREDTRSVLHALTNVVRETQKPICTEVLMDAIFRVHLTLERSSRMLDCILNMLFYYSVWLYFTMQNKTVYLGSSTNVYLYFSLFAYQWLACVVIAFLLLVFATVLSIVLLYQSVRRIKDCLRKIQERKKIENLRSKPFTEFPSTLASAECAICLDEYRPESLLITLPCSAMHHFHETCIKEWLQQKGDCPICRTKLL